MGTDAWGAAVVRLVQAAERLDAHGVNALAAAIEAAPGSKIKARRRRKPDVTVVYPELLVFCLCSGITPRTAVRLWNILVRESEVDRRGKEEIEVPLTVGVVRELATHDRSDFRNYGPDLQHLHRSWAKTL